MKESILNIINSHRELVDDLEGSHVDTLIQCADAIASCIQKGGCIYICGNGGSAADAQHIAGELVGRFQCNRKAFAAVALTTDTSIMTAVANDFAYEDVFARQVEALVGQDDLLWAFSTSGTSANILKAVDGARQKGAVIISFTGRPASPLEAQSDFCLCATSESTARSQEIHQLAYHIICGLVEQRCA
jgi:D-sedoheptulose 7-phosphate isomerase